MKILFGKWWRPPFKEIFRFDDYAAYGIGVEFTYNKFMDLPYTITIRLVWVDLFIFWGKEQK